MPRIPLVDLSAQYRHLGPAIQERVAEALARGQYILGPEVEAFEQAFARFTGARHAVGVGSGLSALELALQALAIGPGDEVITAANTFIATTLAIVAVGARPVPADCCPGTYTLDPAAVAAAVTPRTRAVVPVHLYGQAADMDPILAVAQRHGLAVVEDACQAHGATYRGRPCGTMGEAGCFSFYPGKNLGAAGDAGAVVTNRDDVAVRVRRLRHYGQTQKYHHTDRGTNSRLDTIQAAVLLAKLPHLERWNRQRRRHASVYDRLLAGLNVVRPAVRPECGHVFHLYVIRTRHRDGLRQYLWEQGIETGVHYPVPVHLQPVHADLGYRRGDFPVSEGCSDDVLSLPMYPELTPARMRAVAGAVATYLQGRERRV